MQNNTANPESPYRIFRFTATKRTRKAIQMKYHSWYDRTFFTQLIKNTHNAYSITVTYSPTNIVFI